MSGERLLWHDTFAAWADAFDRMHEGFCCPGCATNDHGECGTADCTCNRGECASYRAEWFA